MFYFVVNMLHMNQTQHLDVQKNKKFLVACVLDSELLHNTEQTLESHGVPTEI